MRLLLLLWLMCSLSAAEPVRLAFRAHLAGGLIISAPTTWTVQPTQPGTVLVLRSPIDGTITEPAARERARAALTVVTQPSTQSLDAFFASCITDLERFGTHLVIDERTTLTQGGLEWRRVAYRFDIGPYTFVQVAQVAMVGGASVIVTCSSGADHLDQWRTAFAAVGAGLRRAGP